MFDHWLDMERGRASAVAAHFGISISAVTQWRENGVPPQHMTTVRELTGGHVSLEEMLLQRQGRKSRAHPKVPEEQGA